MFRNINVSVDTASWPSITPDIQALPTGTWSADVRAALLLLALATRPPTLGGFRLGDTWALLRYVPALASTADLRLCSDWDDVDAHQKSILSDDFGVAFSLLYLARNLGYVDVFETRYFASRVAPGSISFKRTARHGPTKAPDFVLVDGAGNISVLECKGTQSHPDKLDVMMDATHGKAQKGAAQAAGGFRHSLVSGFFIPSFTTLKCPELRLADPEPQDKEWLVQMRNTSAETRRLVSIQLGLARAFFLLEQPEIGDWLDSGIRGSVPPASGFVRDALKSHEVGKELFVSRRHYWRTSDPNTEAKGANALVAEVSLDPEIIKLLLGHEPVRSCLDSLMRDKHLANITIKTQEATAEISTVYGLRLSLSVKPSI